MTQSPGSRRLLEALCAEGFAPGEREEWRITTADRLALAGNSWFSSLPPVVRHDLLRWIRVRSCEPGEAIFRTGAPVQAWMVCLTGAVRIGTSVSASGRSLTLRYLRPGQWFGDLPLREYLSHSHEASTNGIARIGEVDRHAVAALMEKHPGFHGALLEWQSMRLASIYRLLEEHASLDLSARMVRHLHSLAKDHGKPSSGGEVRIELSIAQSDLAALVGCSRQKANKALRELTRQRLIRQEKGTLFITDRRALDHMAGKLSP